MATKTHTTAPKPWLIIDREPCEVTSQWLRSGVGSRAAFAIARDTYRWLYSFDAPGMLACYEVGILNPLDRVQDEAEGERLLAGLRMLAAQFPRACAKARKEAAVG